MATRAVWRGMVTGRKGDSGSRIIDQPARVPRRTFASGTTGSIQSTRTEPADTSPFVEDLSKFFQTVLQSRWTSASRSAPPCGIEPWNPPQGPRLAQKWYSQVYSRHDCVWGTEFCGGAIRLPIVRIVKPATRPPVSAAWAKPPEDGQPAQQTLAQSRIRILFVTLNMS